MLGLTRARMGSLILQNSFRCMSVFNNDGSGDRCSKKEKKESSKTTLLDGVYSANSKIVQQDWYKYNDFLFLRGVGSDRYSFDNQRRTDLHWLVRQGDIKRVQEFIIGNVIHSLYQLLTNHSSHKNYSLLLIHYH